MNTAEKIKVMQAYLDGKPIEYKLIDTDVWLDHLGFFRDYEGFIADPDWAWDRYDYRIKPEDLKCRPYKDVVDIAIDALEKQMPKKPKKYIANGIERDCCPNCSGNKILYRDLQKYCSVCGQAIDWSEE